MSVYTAITAEALAEWLVPLAVGPLRSHAGIAAGIQNSNYFVDTGDGQWVLTLFEQLTGAQLDFYLPLLARYAAAGLPSACPQADAAGRLWRPLAGKPAALLSRLPGRDVAQPTPAQCHTLGATLARLHAASQGMPDPLPNPCGLAWCADTARRVRPGLTAADAALLDDELASQQARALGDLPRGIIHADLFRDNVLWEGERLSGVLDVYFAGEDVLALDIAVCANDWCPDMTTLAALVAGYESVRPLAPAEHAALPGLRRLAALRFWLLRLEAKQAARAGTLVTVKDPDEFRDRLCQLRLAEARPGR